MNKDFDKTIEQFNEAIRNDPNLADVYLKRGNAYLEKCNAYLKEQINAEYDCFSDSFDDVKGYFIKEDFDCAIADYSKFISFNQNNADVYFNRGIAYLEKYEPDYERAIADFNEAIRINPNFAEAYLKRGYINYYEYDDDDGAITDFNEAIKINPNFAEAYYERGFVYEYQDNIKQAIEDFEFALKLEPNNTQYRDKLQQVRDG